jgi:hypothetical protein
VRDERRRCREEICVWISKGEELGIPNILISGIERKSILSEEEEESESDSIERLFTEGKF